MKKLDKKLFFDILNIEEQVLNPFVEDQVSSFKIGRKFVYALGDRSREKLYQQELNQRFLYKIPLNNAAKAFRKHTSYFDFLEPHRYNYNFLRLDIKSFFPSITKPSIVETFSHYIEDELVVDDTGEKLLLNCFVDLVTFTIPSHSANRKFAGESVLPMGFVTSPAISNIIYRKLDIIIQKHCSIHGIEYSRYADDMLFSSLASSSYIHSRSFLDFISQLLLKHGFELNKRKSIYKKHVLSLNGYVIEGARSDFPSGDIRLSHKKLKLLDKLIYELGNGKSNSEVLKSVFSLEIDKVNFPIPNTEQEFKDAYCKDQLLNKIGGYRSYLIAFIKFLMLNNISSSVSMERYSELLIKLEKEYSKLHKS
ncbi:reverse transcriptase (RNA-dependent DNA polymerase) [Alteromonas sp. 76-1]|jgi:RNA-directed DNA polymerase|uniref:reverse transcriptase family protein n=1 Tax=Alteromonas sp. 76-1 TaxID=2358187 RepID=UPI000FD176EC|nr:reverse transcriptase family protein [Alteromonas sp. 76-1]VEL97255.1 reverse transcriptase (RNA-dependent DNA polymerase) [Alteromonas sp. 76-1]